MTYLNRSFLVLAACVVMTGCNTPNPHINPYAGFGSPRVAPPGTGSYAVPNTYYPSTTAPANAGSASLAPGLLDSPSSTSPETFVGQIWKAPQVGAAAGFATNGNAVGSGVQPNNSSIFSVPTNPSPVYSAAPAKLAPPQNNPVALNGTQINPMPVNDATTRGAPSGAVAAGSYVDISQLPNASRAPYAAGQIRGLTPGSYLPVNPQYPVASPIGTYQPPGSVVPAGAIQAIAPTGDPSAALGWRPKYTPDASSGTVIR